jgi:hypothetical protein
MRRTLGIAVFSGMVGVTLFGIFLTPVFFYVIEWFAETSLFSSERVQLLGQVIRFTLGAVTLGILWIPTVLVRGLRHRVPTSAAGTKLHGKVPDGRPAPHGPFRIPQNNEEGTTPYQHNAGNGHPKDRNGDPATSDGPSDRVLRK